MTVRQCNVFHPEMHRYKKYSIRPPVSTHDFGDVSSCEVWRLQGGLGRAQRAGAEAGRWALEDGSGKEGEPKAMWGGAGRQHRPYSYHRQSFQSVTYKAGGGYDEFCEYPLLEKLHFHVALEEVRVTELLSY